MVVMKSMMHNWRMKHGLRMVWHCIMFDMMCKST